MKIEQLIKLPVLTLKEAEANLNLYKEGEDFKADQRTICCDQPDLHFLQSEGWVSGRHCKACNRVIMIAHQDGAAGIHQDPYMIYEEPTEDKPLIPGIAVVNDLIDFINEDPSRFYNMHHGIAEYKSKLRERL